MQKSSLFFTILFSLLLLAACRDGMAPGEKAVEGDAKELLAQTKAAVDAKEYNKAKMLMDSIRRTYPKAFKTLCEVEDLYHKVLVDENMRDVAFCEGELEKMIVLRDSLVKKFDYRKESKYEDFGIYSHPSQAISKNANNCFMRATVNEDAEAVITSYYRGKRIGHKKIKVTSGGTFVEVDVKSADRPWTGREYGSYVERYGFKLGNDGGIMKFIANTQDKVVVELVGESTLYTYELRDSDVKAIREVLELHKVLASIKEIRGMLDEARYALAYLNMDIKE